MQLQKLVKAPVRGLHLAAAAVVSLAFVPGFGPFTGAAHAADQRPLTVGATVAPFARMKMLSQPDSLHITQADIARGYVTVSGGTAQLKSNARRGFLMMVSNSNPAIPRFLLLGFRDTLSFEGSGGVVVRPPLGESMQTATREVHVRLFLGPDVRPGEYPWPIRMDVVPR